MLTCFLIEMLWRVDEEIMRRVDGDIMLSAWDRAAHL